MVSRNWLKLGYFGSQPISARVFELFNLFPKGSLVPANTWHSSTLVIMDFRASEDEVQLWCKEMTINHIVKVWVWAIFFVRLLVLLLFSRCLVRLFLGLLFLLTIVFLIWKFFCNFFFRKIFSISGLCWSNLSVWCSLLGLAVLQKGKVFVVLCNGGLQSKAYEPVGCWVVWS